MEPSAQQTRASGAGVDVMSFDDRRAQLKTIIEQLDQADGRSQTLRIEAGRHLYALRMQWPDGVYGRSVRMLGIRHLKKAAAYIGEYCAAFGLELPPAMQARKDAKQQNVTQPDDTLKVSSVREDIGESDAGGFDVPDATPEQEAAHRAAMTGSSAWIASCESSSFASWANVLISLSVAGGVNRFRARNTRTRLLRFHSHVAMPSPV